MTEKFLARPGHENPIGMSAYGDDLDEITRLREENERLLITVNGQQDLNEDFQVRCSFAEELAAKLAARLQAAEKVVEAIQEAHTEHLKTGDYVRLGIKAQDAIRQYEEGKK